MLTDLLARLYASNQATRRISAAGILLAVAALSIGIVYSALSMIAGSYSALQERRAYLGNLLLIVDAVKGMDDVDAPQHAGTQSVLFQGKNRDVVSAELQNWLNAATREVGAELQSIESLSNADEGKQSYVGLSANIFGAWKPIQNTIFRIESAEPMLFVRNLEIHAASYDEENSEPQVTMRVTFLGATEIAGEGGK
jgi:hypothetical protein